MPAVTRLFAWCSYAGLAMIVAALLTARAGSLRPARELPEGVTSPVLAIELLRSPDDLWKVLRPPEAASSSATGEALVDEPARIARATYLDFVFLVTYVTFLVRAGILVRAIGWRHAGAIAIVAALAAGAFDIAENIAILRLLGERGGTPRVASLLKWASFFVALGFIVPVLFDRHTSTLRRWIGYGAGVLGTFAAVEGVLGVAQGSGLTIEAASQRAVIALFLAVVFVATHQVLRDGLLPALNRLATTRTLGWLTTWPERDPAETVGPPLVEPQDPAGR